MAFKGLAKQRRHVKISICDNKSQILFRGNIYSKISGDMSKLWHQSITLSLLLSHDGSNEHWCFSGASAMWCKSNASRESDMSDLTLVLILLSWSAHVDPWCRGMGTFGNGIIYSDPPPVQLHAVGSLHCLGNARGRMRQRCYELCCELFGKYYLIHYNPPTLHTVTPAMRC